ncbi:MAG: CHAT domain-containing protein [Dolichospermum sp.]|nr:CHAT domain-containing protein [Dolichospermum sp.]
MKTAKNYYTYRIRVAHEELVQVQKWNAQHESMGEPSGKLRYQEKQEEIKKLLKIVSNNELNNLTLTRILGEILFEVLFDNTLRQNFVDFHFQVVQQEEQFLRVELDIDEQRMPELAALPWEFMYLPATANSGEIWLSTDPNLVFSRRRAQWNPAPPIQLEPGEKLRIALAIAAPQDLGEVEYKTVQTALETLAKEQSERIELLPIVNPATPKDIDSLLEKQPHIFHFIGHGRLQDEDAKEVGQIALVKKVFNTANWVDASFFGGLFTRPRLGIVFLQACEGGMLSESEAFVGVASKIVQQNIPVVVAMQYKVSNFTAIQFAYEFYKQLAQDYPVDIAAQNARRTIALDNQYRKRDFATPVVFMRVQDGYLFNSQERGTTVRQKLLEELKADARRKCIKHFRIAVSSQEDAVSLADDLSIGVPPLDLKMVSGKVILLVGQLGVGKTLIAQRLFQQAIQKAEESPNAPIPIYLESTQWQQAETLQKSVENAANGLGDLKTQGAVVILDGLDEVETRRASEILSDAHALVECEKTTVIITSRPTQHTNEIKENNIEVPVLSDEQAYSLIERVTKQQINAFTSLNWNEAIRDAIHRPLFALILAGYLQKDAAKAPRSIGELLSWLVEDALDKVNAERSSCDQLLKRLATLLIECGGNKIRATDVAPTRDALQPLLASRLVVEPSRGTISFPLRILTEWFAALSLADDPSRVIDFVEDPQQLENWRYPLIIATANFNNEVVSQLLIPIAEKYPAFAAEIIRDSSTRWGSDEISLPLSYKCSEQILIAMKAWVKGISSPLSELIAPIQQNGTLRAIGVLTDRSRLEAAWYNGCEEQNIIDLPLDWNNPNSQEWHNWISGKSSRPGHESAWSWRWTLNELISNLSQHIQYPILPVDSRSIIREAAWRAAIAIIKYRQNQRLTTLKYWEIHEIPLNEIEETLSKVEAQAKLNYYITLPDIGSPLKVQDYYLKQLRKEVEYIKSLGRSTLHNPWPNLNRILGEQDCEEFNLEQLRIRATKIYKAALDAYQEITNTWFKPLIPGMKRAAMLPVLLVGAIAPSDPQPYDPKPFGNYVDFDLFLEALPEKTENEVDIVINKNRLDFNVSDNRVDIANEKLIYLRPKSAVWIKYIPHTTGFSDVLFRASPVTIIGWGALSG